jgi:hypothetical protein
MDMTRKTSNELLKSHYFEEIRIRRVIANVFV